jgi:DNA-binding transcriptional ArsR family regulator
LLVGAAMSHRAIAAALALEEVSGGERLTAFSLASFANSEQRAWPGTRLAAARAGLSRSQYLVALRSLSDRGLVEIEDAGGGRGHSALVRLRFADDGESVDAEINAQLFEAVLSYTRAKGSARALLAVLAALSAPHGGVDEVSTEVLCSAAGISERTYRRACAQLRKDGLLHLERAGGGRGRMNRWVVSDPRKGDALVGVRTVVRRPSVPRGARSRR